MSPERDYSVDHACTIAVNMLGRIKSSGEEPAAIVALNYRCSASAARELAL